MAEAGKDMALRATFVLFAVLAAGTGGCRSTGGAGADVPADVSPEVPTDLPLDVPPDWDVAACGAQQCVTGTECFCVDLAKTKVDLLLVLDDSPSMCGVFGRMDAFVGNLVGESWDAYDLRVAVTTPGACGANHPQEALGAFVYRPLDGSAQTCPVRHPYPCLTDADCVQGATANLWPDTAHWACEPADSGTPFACDTPPARDAPGPEGALFSIDSACRYVTDWVGPGGPCPSAGLTTLDSGVVQRTFQDWKAGTWAGEAGWTALSDDAVRKAIFARLLGCMTRIGPSAAPCAGPRQGLRAAWEALDPAGPNAAQSKAFLREGASLLVMVLSDQDDCSYAASGAASAGANCACQRDTQGCLPTGACNPQSPGPLVAPIWLEDRLEHLGRAYGLLSIGGDVVPGTATSPTTDAEPIRARYFDCRCAATADAASVYACNGDAGTVGLGARYRAASYALWLADHAGAFVNLCDDGWTNPWPWRNPGGMPMLQAFCLPRPLGAGESVRFAVLDPAPGGACVAGGEGDDFTMLQNSPVCPVFDVPDGARRQNAIQPTRQVPRGTFVQACITGP
jgi:hypothetical protein